MFFSWEGEGMHFAIVNKNPKASVLWLVQLFGAALWGPKVAVCCLQLWVFSWHTFFGYYDVLYIYISRYTDVYSNLEIVWTFADIANARLLLHMQLAASVFWFKVNKESKKMAENCTCQTMFCYALFLLVIQHYACVVVYFLHLFLRSLEAIALCQCPLRKISVWRIFERVFESHKCWYLYSTSYSHIRQISTKT